MTANDPATRLVDTRRHFLFSILRIAMALISLVFVIGLISLVVIRNPLLRIYIFAIFILWAGAGLSLWLIRKRPLGQSLIPVISSILAILLFTSLRLPFIIPPAFVLLAMVILLVSITGNRRLTLVMALVSIAIAVITLNVPHSVETITVVEANRVIASVGISAILLIIWLIADRYTYSQETITLLATQRALEAEAARTDAESARAETEQRYAEQHRLLELVQSLELPIISIGQDILAVPLVGNLDNERITAIQKRLLDSVARQHARLVILDVTGIAMMDAQTAHALLQTVEAVRLLGAQTILSGIGANNAHILVGLGFEFNDIQTISDMGQALEYARVNFSSSDTSLLGNAQRASGHLKPPNLLY